jgi:metal-responsive CopG/Arc/MetJ family transcriptional regulator
MTTITTTIRLPEDLVRAMQRLHARDGIVMSEQIRRALREYLTKKKTYTPRKERKTR